MFKLFDKVYLWEDKNVVWTVVGFSENTVDATFKRPMIKLSAPSKMTYAKEHELTKAIR